MNPREGKSGQLSKLRERAEAVLGAQGEDLPNASPEEVRKLVQELRTHQIELEMQNEDLRRAQEELVESRDRYSDLYDFAPVGYLTVSEQGLILKANLTVAEMLGVERARLIQRRFSAFLVDEDQEIYSVLRRQLLKTRQRQTYELRMRSKDGRSFWAKTESTLTGDADTGGLQILTVISDITERKTAEAEAQAAHQKLLAQQRREQQRVEKANRELERRNRELQDFVHVASHDLRAPLVNIRGFTDALASFCRRARTAIATIEDEESLRAELIPLLDEEIPDSLAYIHTNSTKMDALLTGLLNLSRIGRAALAIERLDLNRLLAEIVQSMKFSAEQAGATIEVGTLTACRGDRTQVGQVFSNLLDNALKHLDPTRPGVIRVSAQKKGSQVVYCMEDNGVGIDAEDQEAIYRLFHRLDPERGTGHGLGLTIVRRVLDRHGGEIWLESVPNQGSKFFVSLPAG
jgi:PAS domain S-box-containing protein